MHSGCSGPRGGITRVWEQILTTWSLPGLVSAAAPITLIDREGCSALLSRIECFGLPVVEASSAGGVVIRADARGLREAGAGAAPCVDVDDPAGLARWVRLLMHPPSHAWLQPHLRRRWGQRHRRLQPDRLGLALLAQARTLAS